MENADHQHHHQAVTRLSPSPPHPPPSPKSAAAEALANARWTPTKEQIFMLEGLYSRGLRTPSSEQIQQITARLREHGPIEGKNVFYWFQNHKARERNKQEKQAFEYFARQFQRPQPLPILHRAPGSPFPRAAPAPPPQRPACNREVMLRNQQHAAYYAQTLQQQQAPLQYPRMDMPRDNVPAHQAPPGAVYYQHPAGANAGTRQHPLVLDPPPATGGHTAANGRPVRPTLNLFPLHPTFSHREKKMKARHPATASSAVPSASFSWESESSGSHNGESSVQFYDFFSLNPGGW